VLALGDFLEFLPGRAPAFGRKYIVFMFSVGPQFFSEDNITNGDYPLPLDYGSQVRVQRVAPFLFRVLRPPPPTDFRLPVFVAIIPPGPKPAPTWLLSIGVAPFPDSHARPLVGGNLKYRPTR